MLRSSIVLVALLLPSVSAQCANGPSLGPCVGGICPPGYTCDTAIDQCCPNSAVPPPLPNPPAPGGNGGCTDAYGQACARFGRYCNVFPFSVCLQRNCAQTCGTCGAAGVGRASFGRRG